MSSSVNPSLIFKNAIAEHLAVIQALLSQHDGAGAHRLRNDPRDCRGKQGALVR